MPSELLQKQWQFAHMTHALMGYAFSQGYELTFGDAYRDPRVPYGHPESVHKLKLAIDFNLFVNGVYRKDTESHLILGDFWKGIGGTWGGDFMKLNKKGELEPDPDGNHYSISHEGRK